MKKQPIKTPDEAVPVSCLLNSLDAAWHCLPTAGRSPSVNTQEILNEKSICVLYLTSLICTYMRLNIVKTCSDGKPERTPAEKGVGVGTWCDGELLTESAALLPLGEVLEAVGGAALSLLVLLDVPRQLGGDVGDEAAAGPQAVVVAPHPELAVLPRGKRYLAPFHTLCHYNFYISC